MKEEVLYVSTVLAQLIKVYVVAYTIVMQIIDRTGLKMLFFVNEATISYSIWNFFRTISNSECTMKIVW